MAHDFMKFNNFSLGSMNAIPAFNFNMPAINFSMPDIFSHMPPLFSFQPRMNTNFSLPQNIDTSLYREEVLAVFNPQTTGTKFDSLKLTDFSLDGFEAVSYAPKPMNFTLPSFDFTSITAANTAKTNTSKSYNTSAASIKPNTATSLAQVAEIYNKSKGKKLAAETIEGLRNAQKGYCARAVKTGIVNAGLGVYESGNADDIPNILSRNKNFKEVHVKGADLAKLPAGCIKCYPPGECGYSSKYGHVETSDGNGNAVSFFVNRNIKQSDNVRVFVPV